MSNTPPMSWGSRLANYAAQNGSENVRLKPGQLRRWHKKHNAQLRRERYAEAEYRDE